MTLRYPALLTSGQCGLDSPQMATIPDEYVKNMNCVDVGRRSGDRFKVYHACHAVL